MSFLNFRKDKKEDETQPKKLMVSEGALKISPQAKPHILRRPRITEKASKGAEQSVYVFEVDKSATKKEIASAVGNYYKVNPRKISIVNLPRKKIIVKGKAGLRGGVKKAYVYLKQGDKIEII